MARCCGNSNPVHQALLARVAALGAALPDDAQIWGPADGWAWRVVDRHGREPFPPIRSTVPIRILAATAVLIIELGDQIVTIGA